METKDLKLFEDQIKRPLGENVALLKMVRELKKQTKELLERKEENK